MPCFKRQSRKHVGEKIIAILPDSQDAEAKICSTILFLKDYINFFSENISENFSVIHAFSQEELNSIEHFIDEFGLIFQMLHVYSN